MKKKTKLKISGIISLVIFLLIYLPLLIMAPIFTILFSIPAVYFLWNGYKHLKYIKKKNDNLHKKLLSIKGKLNLKLSLKQMDSQQLIDLSNEKKAELHKSKVSLKNVLNLLKEENNKLEDLKAEVNDLDSESEMSEYGLYNPHYEFENTWEYKDALKSLRHRQKYAVKTKVAVSYNPNWDINGSRRLGRRSIRNNIKAIMRSFNNECTNAIKKVRYSNYDRIQKRIKKSFKQHNKIFAVQQVRIRYSYLNLKLKELRLAFEYKCKKEDEREKLKEERQSQREQKQLAKETKKKLKPIHKDITQYTNAINELKQRVKDESNNQGLINEITKLKDQINDKNKEAKSLNHNVYNAQAGYVYIISNIGSFGKNIFKIGVTRRIDPSKRVQELSSASVPFKFDIHAFIFSTHAFDLETKLHHHFHKHRVNLVNNHKEFFHISLDDIKNELKKYRNVTVDFNEYPKADEYRQTVKILHNKDHKNRIQSILADVD